MEIKIENKCLPFHSVVKIFKHILKTFRQFIEENNFDPVEAFFVVLWRTWLAQISRVIW